MSMKTEKNREKTLSTADVATEVQTEHLLIISQDRYRNANPFNFVKNNTYKKTVCYSTRFSSF
jgi:hypothetical protein